MNRGLVSVFLVIAGTGCAHAQVHKCMVEGVVVYQETPCTPAPPPPARRPDVRGAGDQQQDDAKRRADADARRAEQARQREQIQKGFADPITQRPIPVSRALPGSSLTQAQVCKATIALLMGHDASIMNFSHEQGGVSLISYTRPSDRRPFTFMCRVEGNRVLWGNPNGRWRDTPADEQLYFKELPVSLVLTELFRDGSSRSKTYPLNAL